MPVWSNRDARVPLSKDQDKNTSTTGEGKIDFPGLGFGFEQPDITLN
jgi:hypothetical protein